jgi:diamine N-acetyltransferase
VESAPSPASGAPSEPRSGTPAPRPDEGSADRDWPEDNGPILNIVGEKVALGPHRRDFIPLYHRWINDFEVTRTMGMLLRPTTWEAEEDWYDRVSHGDRPGGHFTIYERATLRPIGTTSIFDVDQNHRTGEFGIMIGAKDCWNRGYGTETARLMLDYAFTALGLHNVLLRVYSFNARGIRAYTKAGFKICGRRREAFRFGGRPYDVISMECLATEFDSPVLRQLLP